ncbi:hypothetical protein C8R48DRAFT_743186, partial [Suillus tomentosus]
IVHAQSCRPVQALCYQILVIKQSAFDQDISHRRAAFRHHCVLRPEASLFDVYFKPYPVGSPVDAKQKLKAPNALLPTIISCTGGIVEYAVNMGSELPSYLPQTL